jgi:ubiquinone/menaquinone biosynthesis C-methylase UbiE
MPNDDLVRAFRGDTLYGDNFSPAEIREWFDDEREAYANLGAKERGAYRYGYHGLNTEHGFQHLPDRRFDRVLSFGGAYGDELLPVIRRVQHVVISDPSDALGVSEIHGMPVRYTKPQMDGHIAFPDEAFDLVTCFGVLHHIPNVSAVIAEFYRCLAPGGYALVREPIISMGDWRRPRRGLTQRERGIPIAILRRTLHAAGFRVMRETLCMFPLTYRLHWFLKEPVFNYRSVVKWDRLASSLFAWNLRYHATNFAQKLRPASAFYVLQKPARTEPA